MSRNDLGRDYREKRARILKDSDVCHICGQPGADTIDHKLPRARGGTNALPNLAPAHAACNRAKSDKDHAPIVKRCGSLR